MKNCYLTMVKEKKKKENTPPFFLMGFYFPCGSRGAGPGGKKWDFHWENPKFSEKKKKK